MFIKHINPLFLFFSLCLIISCNHISDAEINSYALLTKSLDNSNKNIAWVTERSLMFIEEEAKTRLQHETIATKAQEITKLTRNYYKFIDSLKQEILNISVGVFSNKKAPKTILTTNKNALLLKTKTIQLKQQYLDTIASLWDNGGIKESIFCAINRKPSNIKKLNANITLDSCINDWEEQTFKDLPTIAALALLTKMQNDAKLSEATLIDFLVAQFGRHGGNCMERYNILSSTTQNTIHLGETYKTIIHIGMPISSLGYDLFINNKPASHGVFTTVPKSIGNKELHVQLRKYNHWTGEKEVITKRFEYRVIK